MGKPKNRLKLALLKLRPALAAAAQRVYDEWQQDEQGLDEYLGSGGICQDVADALASVVHSELPWADIEIMDTEGVDDQHVWIVVYHEDEAYHVDIPPSTYETGSGYSWRKRPGVELDQDDVIIHKDSDFVPAEFKEPSKERRAAFLILSNKKKGKTSARSLVGDAIKEALDVKRWQMQPTYVRYLSKEESEDNHSRYFIFITEAEMNLLTDKIIRSAAAAGWDTPPVIKIYYEED